MSRTLAYQKQLPQFGKEYDVVVCGAGPAGVAAAIASARSGATTLLIESQGQLGGMSTSGMVSHWLGGRSNDSGGWIVGGIFRELSMRSAARGIACIPDIPLDGTYSPHGWDKGQLVMGIPFDPYRMAAFLDEIVSEEGIDVLLQTQVADTLVENDRICGIVICNKSGLQQVVGECFIDATGDADLAARSGCPVRTGRDKDGLMAPATVEMHICGVDSKAMGDYINTNDSPRFLEEIQSWAEAGEWPFSYNRLITVQTVPDDSYMVNTSRLCGVDGTDGLSITQGLMAGRKENLELFDIAKKKVPGFSGAQIKGMGTTLGVRETRRIVSDLTMTVEDLVNGAQFEHVIGYSAYGWDLPDPKKPSNQPMHNKAITIHNNRTPLPFEIMVPQKINNLLCPGRAVSVEREVLGPVRVMAPCMAMGEAAGVAAAMVCNSADLKNLNRDVLCQTLKKRGAVVDIENVIPA